jgi:4'-phosphopantetheinyl transferase
MSESVSERIDWQEAPSRPDLRPGDLHLWRIHTHDLGADPAFCMTLLAEGQRGRALRMRHAPYRDRYVRAQAGLRLILSRYLDASPRAIRFERGPAGKPNLPPKLGLLSFNLTTTGDLALLAVSAGSGPDAELGVDCEWIRPRHDIQAVAERMFSPEVVAAIRAAAETDRLAHFYRAWTALEADAKADGRGLFRPRPPQTRPPSISHFIPVTGYVAAIARQSLPPMSEWSTYEGP